MQPLTPEKRQTILAANDAMASSALRVLGVAFRSLTEIPEEPTPERVERNLVFLGLLGMIDPARPEVKVAVAVAKGAGLKSVMVTGDYKDTATAIADEIGMLSEGGRVLTGAEIERMSDAELAAVVDHVDAYARVSPQHKMRIVDALKANGHVVAMTGDGVNDAPALKRANIGIAMGITGTDVTKETADMVLTDDNFASIVSAIEEGRIIYSNIRKFVFYLISCNIGEILIIFISMLAGLPIPLRPIQLLWLNLVTDGAPALALGLEKGDPDIMKRPPRPAKEPVINREMLLGIGIIPIADTIAVLGSFLLALNRFGWDNVAGRPNGSLCDVGHVRVAAGVHRPFRANVHIQERERGVRQQVDGVRHRHVVPAPAAGDVCAFLACRFRHGALEHSRLGDHVAIHLGRFDRG